MPPLEVGEAALQTRDFLDSLFMLHVSSGPHSARPFDANQIGVIGQPFLVIPRIQNETNATKFRP
jgi:hypothetical protein